MGKSQRQPAVTRFQPRWVLLGLVVGVWVVWLAAYFNVVVMQAAAGTIEESIEGRPGEVVRRWQQLSAQLLLPDETMRSWVLNDARLGGIRDRIPVLAAAALISAWGWMLGSALLRLARVRGLSGLERFVFSSASGINLLSVYLLLSGWLWGWRPGWRALAPLSALSVAVVGFSWRPWAVAGRDSEVGAAAGWSAVRKSIVSSHLAASGGKGATIVCLTLLMLLSGWLLLNACLPPFEFDVREYHLQAPKEWFLAGSVDFLPHNVYANMPLGAELPSVLGMLLFAGDDAWWWGALVGKVVMGWQAILLVAGVWATARRWFGVQAAYCSALVLLATPIYFRVATRGLNESVLGCYAFLALYAVILWRDSVSTTRGRPNIASQSDNANQLNVTPALSGWLAGAAMAVKYTAVPFLVLPLGAYVAIRSLRRWSLAVVIWGLACLAGGGLWYAKNTAVAGNPVYPLAFNLLGGKTWNQEKNHRWTAAHRPPRDAQGRAYSLASAWDAVRRSGWSGEMASPVLLPLAVCGLLVSPRRRLLAPWAVWTLCVAIVWFGATHRLERFLIPTYPALALMAGAGVGGDVPLVWRRMGAWLAGLGVAVGCLTIASPQMSAGCLTRLEVLRQDPLRVRVHPVLAYLNAHVPSEGVVLLVGEAQPFDLERKTLYSTCFDDSPLKAIVAETGARERWEALRKLGVTHVFVNWGEIERYRSPGNYGFPAFITRALIRDELEFRQHVWRRVTAPELANEYWDVLEVAPQQPDSS